MKINPSNVEAKEDRRSSVRRVPWEIEPSGADLMDAGCVFIVLCVLVCIDAVVKKKVYLEVVAGDEMWAMANSISDASCASPSQAWSNSSNASMVI
jgi:hypothetical protein